MKTNKTEISTNPMEVSRRIAIFPKETPVKFNKVETEEKLVSTFPHLIIREIICFQLLVIFVALLALFIDAPLEEFANPRNTPNPAKAPWYFLGLQELLHSFPPFIAGILIPGIVIVALIIIPYFDINIKRNGLWRGNKSQTLLYLTTGLLAITGVSIFYSTYGILLPTLIIYSLMLLSFFIKKETGIIGWLSNKSFAEWIMSWFVLMSVVLTIIGTLFRGPGWAWIWPW